MSNKELALWAERELGRFKRIELPTEYIAGFRTKRFREIALERDRKDAIYVWTEVVEYGDMGFPHPTIYSKSKSRNSNLNRKNSPRLIQGKSVLYWQLEKEDFSSFLDWYEYK